MLQAELRNRGGSHLDLSVLPELEQMVDLSAYDSLEQDFLMNTHPFSVESDDEDASSGDEEELPDYLDSPINYTQLHEPLYTSNDLFAYVLVIRAALVSGRFGGRCRSISFVAPSRLTRHFLPLKAKKKKSAGGSGAKKIQVKLLQHVAGTGKAGEVVRVNPPFFNNKLRPTKLAVVITDEEVARERLEASEKHQQTMEAANAVKKRLENVTVKISKKAGPDGKLYGGIGAKVIMAEVRKHSGKHMHASSRRPIMENCVVVMAGMPYLTIQLSLVRSSWMQ